MNKPILITSYENPDLDAVACAISYNEFLQKIGKDSVVRIFGEPHDEARYVLDRFGIEYPLSIENPDSFDEVILVDVSDIKSIDGKISLEKVIEVIDHRKINDADKFLKARVQIEPVGSAATLIAEKFRDSNVPISRESAILLYSAIISNTANFNQSICTDRDRDIALWLNNFSKLEKSFWEELFVSKSDLSDDDLAKRIRHDFKTFTIRTKIIGVAQIEIIEAEKLVIDRNIEIIGTLDEIKKEMSLDFVFQNTIDLTKEKNFFVTKDVETQKLLEKAFNIKFINNVAEKSGILFRKQIIPTLMNCL